MRRWVLGCVALLLAGCTTSTPTVQLESVGAGDPGSEVCMPVADDGSASFAWESVRNTSDVDVEVVGVVVDDPRVEVTEWFLVGEDWTKAGVTRGSLPPPGRDRLPDAIRPGGTALVAMTVRSAGLTGSRDMRALVQFAGDAGDAGDREPGELELSWRLRIVPAGQQCGA